MTPLSPLRLARGSSVALAALLLLGTSLGQEGEDKGGPDPAKVAAAVANLKKGLAERDPALRVQALQSASSVAHEDVVDLISKKALRDKEMEVVRYAIDVLGLMAHDEARVALEGFLKRDKRIREDHEAFALLVRSIGRHASPKSITPLTKDLFAVRERDVVQARILSLGNIRDPRAVKELFKLMSSVDRRRLNPYMDEFRIALMLLTGVDQGESPERWLAWWNDNKKALKVGKKAPALPEKLQRRWDGFWGNERRYERPKKRGERGNDPEDDGDGRAPEA